jgi:DNA-directed RNA polymerase specialized sigma subunit
MKVLLIAEFLSRDHLSRNTARYAQSNLRLPIARNARQRANRIRAIENDDLQVICCIALSRAGE